MPSSRAVSDMYSRMRCPSEMDFGFLHGRNAYAMVSMSESERTPGYRNKSHVPPIPARDPGITRGDRRHVGFVPVSWRSLGLGHAHHGVRISAVEKSEIHFRRASHSRVHIGYGTRGRHRQTYSVSSQSCSRGMVVTGRALEGADLAKAA